MSLVSCPPDNCFRLPGWNDDNNLQEWLNEFKSTATHSKIVPRTKLQSNKRTEIRLFLSSTFVDTQAERNAIITRVIPKVNNRLKKRFIEVIPVDLRWGVLPEESKDFRGIQTKCLNQIEECREHPESSPWFLALRTSRYGWVQDEVMSSNEFNSEVNFQWINQFKQSGLKVSITSLECLHASMNPQHTTNSPRMLAYERIIDNLDDIPEDMRWKYRFDNADERHKGNLVTVTDCLKNSEHVNFSEYHCVYRDGDLKDLEDFERMVEEDLIEAILSNFIFPAETNLEEFELETIQHENSVIARSQTFVGREENVDHCLEFCRSDNVESNILMVYGKPGVGKSGIIAKVSADVLNKEMERKNAGMTSNFTFIHCVDVTPNSNHLEHVLMRLQLCLRKYCREVLDDSIESKIPQSMSELKSEHHDFLRETALKHKSVQFLIIVDAVNQLKNTMASHRMWWLPRSDDPKNLKFIFSTITQTVTFENTLKIRSDSTQLPVKDMLEREREEMVKTLLDKYNKKLSNTEDPKLGNQMKALINKNGSPLYLYSAVEALRAQGVFEKISDYIINMPKDVSSLFQMLLTEWCQAHGEDFVLHVCGLLCFSQNGLMELQINDILSSIENERKEAYTSSFSRFYDTLRPFLASGGGGLLRFFHQELTNAAKEKLFNSPSDNHATVFHVHLSSYFTSCIKSQLVYAPTDEPTIYYEHCLNEITYHQTALLNLLGTVDFSSTLYNIYFIRERIVKNQLKLLLNEYSQAIAIAPEAVMKELKQWHNFVRFYGPHIKKFPQWSHHFATTQPSASVVTTMALKVPLPPDNLPLTWLNKPPHAMENESLTLVPERCLSCAVTSVNTSLCCIGGDAKAYLCDQSNGEIIHQVKIPLSNIYAVHLSSLGDLFFTGSDKGELSAWSIYSGTLEWTVNMGEYVIWIDEVSGNMMCGTGSSFLMKHFVEGNVYTMDRGVKDLFLSTNDVCFSYACTENILVSGHGDFIKAWNMISRQLIKQFAVCDVESKTWPFTKFPVLDICFHPQNSSTVLFAMSLGPLGEIKTLDLTTGACATIVSTAKFDFAKYDTTGDRILCVHPNDKTILVYNNHGDCLNKIQLHANAVYCLGINPGTNSFVSVGLDGAKVGRIPQDIDNSTSGECVKWCQWLNAEYITLNSEGVLKVWDGSTSTLLGSVEVMEQGGSHEPHWLADVHPSNLFVVVCTSRVVYIIDINDCCILHTQKVPYYDQRTTIYDVRLSHHLCVIATYRHGTHVYELSDSMTLHYVATITAIQEGVWSCDVRDNDIVIAGRQGIILYNHQNDMIRTLRESIARVARVSHFVRFSQYGPHILYHIRFSAGGVFDEIRLMNMAGEDLITFDSQLDPTASRFFELNSRHLITCEYDGSFRVHEVTSNTQETNNKKPKVMYAFVHHVSQGFNCFLANPGKGTLHAYNYNGVEYVFDIKCLM